MEREAGKKGTEMQGVNEKESEVREARQRGKEREKKG